MPAGFVIDASVVVEFCVPQRSGAAADRLLGGLAWPEPVELFAPDLLLLEVANAFRGLVLGKALTDAAANRAVERLPRLAIALVASGALLEAAWSLRKRMTVYDGAYAGLARALQRPLVSADARLVRACRAANIEAFRVDQSELGAVLDTIEP
ncbi:MAG: type II toxin-antitoxin system VapC family toxin [Actinomycetota bacterium]